MTLGLAHVLKSHTVLAATSAPSPARTATAMQEGHDSKKPLS